MWKLIAILLSFLVGVFVGGTISVASFWFDPNGPFGLFGKSWQIVATTAPAKPPRAGTEEKHQEALFSLAKASVERYLFDPYTAVFDDLKLVKDDKKIESVCGIVNAKNRMGAYVGRTPFVYERLLDIAFVWSDEQNSGAQLIRNEITKNCGSEYVKAANYP